MKPLLTAHSGMLSIAAEVEIPKALAEAIKAAVEHLATERRGRVSVEIGAQSFRTWWATRSPGRPTTDIEFTPRLCMRTPDRDIYGALVTRGTDGGAIWTHPDAVRRMVRWVCGGDDPMELAHSPFSDEEARARWQAEHGGAA